MGTTFALLASQTITNNTTTTFTWSGIPQDYTDLQVVANVKGYNNSANNQIPLAMRINGSSTAIYSQAGVLWSTAAKADIAFTTLTYVTLDASLATNQVDTAYRNLFRLYFPRYSETNASRKQGYFDGTSGYNSTIQRNYHVSWIYDSANTSGISSITFLTYNSNNWFGNGSQFYLYGINRNA